MIRQSELFVLAEGKREADDSRVDEKTACYRHGGSRDADLTSVGEDDGESCRICMSILKKTSYIAWESHTNTHDDEEAGDEAAKFNDSIAASIHEVIGRLGA